MRAKGGPATESLWTNQLIAGLTGIVAAVLSLMIARRLAPGATSARRGVRRFPDSKRRVAGQRNSAGPSVRVRSEENE